MNEKDFSTIFTHVTVGSYVYLISAIKSRGEAAYCSYVRADNAQKIEEENPLADLMSFENSIAAAVTSAARKNWNDFYSAATEEGRLI